MMKTFLAGAPLFIPRVTRNESTVLTDGFSTTVHDYLWVPGRGNLKTIDAYIKTNCRSVLLNPFTMDMQYAHCMDDQVKSLRGLPHWRGRPLEPEDFDDSTFLLQYVADVVDLQRGRATYILPPHFFATSAVDPWHAVNLAALDATLSYVKQTKCSQPVLAVVATEKDTVCKPSARKKLLDAYVEVDVAGYVVFLDQLDERKDSLAVLTASSGFLMELQDRSQRPVMSGWYGPFGLVLLSLGLAGFSAGLNWLDSFKVQYMKDAFPGFNPDATPKSEYQYYPDLLGALSPKETSLLRGTSTFASLSCTCTVCSARNPVSAGERRIHFLEVRYQEVAALQAFSLSRRPKFMLGRIERAKDLRERIAQEGLYTRLRAPYLDRWADVIRNLS